MTNPTRMHDLRGRSLEELEALYCAAPIGPRPSGIFRGEVLARVESRFAESARGRMLLLPFARLRFGIDFDACAWFFWAPRWRVGRFRAELGPSRWREAEVLRLDYGVSHLPRPIRGELYDEVKPLTATLCLGLGGVNAGRGDGDLFFFGLEAIGVRPAGVRS